MVFDYGYVYAYVYGYVHEEGDKGVIKKWASKVPRCRGGWGRTRGREETLIKFQITFLPLPPEEHMTTPDRSALVIQDGCVNK